MIEALGPGETLDRLSGDWWIFQLQRGHRYATDDVVTAWTAWRARSGALALLDLCSGVGSIGLMTLRLLSPKARLTSVEIQPQSVSLARRTVSRNQLESRVDIRLGDLRDPAVIAGDEVFDLITSNPPFLPRGSGPESPHPQRRAARFELHGDVFDVCRIAAEHLAPEGRFCLCHAAADPRPQRAVAEAGLIVLQRRDVVFRRGRRPQIALYTCGWEGDRADAPELCVREAGGERTDAYIEVLREVGILA